VVGVTGFGFVPRLQVADRWSALAVHVDGATVAAGRTLPVCRHVLTTGASSQPAVLGFGIVCAVCCNGIRCKDCHNSHTDQAREGAHNEVVEDTCDGCGSTVEWITPVAMVVSLGGRSVRVRGLDGRRRQVAVPVAVAGLGLCRGCRPGVAS
jgi:hypothetical protein